MIEYITGGTGGGGGGGGLTGTYDAGTNTPDLTTTPPTEDAKYLVICSWYSRILVFYGGVLDLKATDFLDFLH